MRILLNPFREEIVGKFEELIQLSCTPCTKLQYISKLERGVLIGERLDKGGCGREVITGAKSL
jgi:hypothetical protein